MTCKKCGKEYRPRGRTAHSPENRTGQAWRPGKEEMKGEDIFGNKKSFLVEVGHFLCKKCAAVVRIDKNGYAACEKCGLIYNDGMELKRLIGEGMSSRGRKRALERFKYDCLHKEDQSGRSALSAIAIDFFGGIK